MKHKLILLLLLLPFSVCLAFAKDDVTNQYEVEIAEIGSPGTLVLRVWCYSKKPKVADELFRANAIRGILFKGLEDSGRMKGRKALVTDGYESHKDYFDSFFKNSLYNNYTRIAMDGYVEQSNLVKVNKYYKIAKIVVVSFDSLRKQLENDKIIRGLTSGF